MTQMTNIQKQANAMTISMPGVLLRLEGLTAFIGAVMAYIHLGGSGLMFIALLFIPDVGMVGYMVNTRLGAAVYNLAHLYTIPAALLAVGLASGQLLMVQVALIWVAHIGMDRIAGYGFKYETGFKDTHLGRV